MRDKDTEVRKHSLIKNLSRSDILISYPKFQKLFYYLLPPIIALLIMVAVWEICIKIWDVPIYIAPGPTTVFSRLSADPMFFLTHGLITLWEAISGFILGASIALWAAVIMVRYRFLERILLPVAVAIKVTPIVAVAPLFVIWFGFGMVPKVLIVGLITFFPVLVNAISGLKSVNSNTLDLFHSVNASNKEIFIRLRIPNAMPYLFAAFRISLPLSVIGAVIGEWFSGDKGLGSVIMIAHSNLNTPTLFGAIIILCVTGVLLTVILYYLENKILFWSDR